MKDPHITWPAGRRFAASLFSCLLLLTMAVGSASAQQSAAIAGTVTDASGAAVPGATVTVKSVETGATRTLSTDNAGVYRALSLPVGNYQVQVEKQGFKTVVRNGITLVVGQQAELNMQLEVGQVAQAVTVTGEAPLVNTTPASTSGLVGEQQVKDLPLNGRSFDNLVTLNPGSSNTTSYRSPSSTGGGHGNNFSVDGNREDYNLFLMNGVEYTGVSTADVVPGGVSGQLLGVDAVREFNVQQNTYGAEYGKRPGGQVNVVTMSGGNQFHGTAFEFLRNSIFDANNYFNQNGNPPFKRNQFGGSAGGPIRRDKTFIFGNYEGFRQRLALSSVAIVPDANAQKGILPGVKNPITLAPGISNYFQLWPSPIGAQELLNKGQPTGAAEVFTNPLQSIREDFGNLRVDQMFSSKDTVSGVYTIDDGNSLTPGSNPLQQTLSDQRAHVFSLSETHIFSSAMLNTARVGFSRAVWHLDTSPPVNPPGLSWVPGMPVGSISIGSSGLGNVGTFSNAGSGGGQQVENVARNLFTYADDVAISKNKHQISFGVWFERVQANDDAADQRNGVASFQDLQHFLQGQAQQVVATLDPARIGWRQLEGAWYVQDTIRAYSNLTISLGLRHEFNNGWNSPDGKASNFALDSRGVPITQPVIGTSVYATNHAKWLFGPRIGIAWQPFGSSNTVVHLGYGLYYNQMDYVGSCCDASPLPPLNSKISVGSKSTPQAFPLIMSTNLPGATIAPSGIDPNFKTPAVHQYSFKIEHGITNNLKLSVGYVGETGYDLTNTVDNNSVTPVVCPASPCPAMIPAGSFFFPSPPPGGKLKLANPQLASARYTTSNANSNYNGVEVDITRRFSAGLQFRGTYTFAKSLDDHSSSFLANAGVGGTTTIEFWQAPRLDWGRSNFDQTHRVAGNFSYELPFGRGKFIGNGVTGAADKLISGWQWNGILSIMSGFPFTPLVGFSQSNDGDSRFPDRVSLNPNFQGNPIVGSPNEWFNPAAFILPPAGTFGNAGRDILNGPGLFTFDTSLFKTTTLTERTKLEFRAEAFNLFNRANFGLPVINMFTSTGALQPSTGLITYTATTARQLQFGLKVIW